MTSVKSPFFFRWLSPQYLLCDLPSEEKVIYLTFDDGPIPEATPEILEILKKHEAKATFFVVGDNVRKHPDIFELIKQEGHAIGNHTFHHLNGWHTSPGLYMDDVYRCRDYFETQLFRPPYGRFTPSQYFLLRKDFRFVLWSVLTHDFRRHTTSGQCLENAIEHSYGGAIVVFHDNLKSIDKVSYALPRFLDHFGALGFRFEGIGTRDT
jgi:peptidoglycan/xylan/chitin deacetylase (PgdA/CDA1 family)